MKNIDNEYCLKKIIELGLSPSYFLKFSFFYSFTCFGSFIMAIFHIALVSYLYLNNELTQFSFLVFIVVILSMFFVIIFINFKILLKKDGNYKLNKSLSYVTTQYKKNSFSQLSLKYYINYFFKNIEHKTKINLLDYFLNNKSSKLNLSLEEYLSLINNFDQYSYSELKQVINLYKKYELKYNPKYGEYNIGSMIKEAESLLLNKFQENIQNF